MKISLIIPVYNAKLFLEKAVDSALQFSEIQEVILIEDGCPNGSLAVCESVQKKDNRIKIFQHPNGLNKGAGASRNLGIKQAKYDWIAFLDADDYFLPNRFNKEIELYNAKTDFDGVYGALGVHFYSEKARSSFNAKFNKATLTTVNQIIKPNELKYALFGLSKNNKGYFSIDTLTVKKSLLFEVGLFNEALRLHQDTDLLFKISMLGKLYSGSIDKAVAVRGVHEENRITSTNVNYNSRLLLYQELNLWTIKYFKDKVIQDEIDLLLKYYSFLNTHKTYSISQVVFFSFKNKTILYSNKYFNLLIRKSNAKSSVKDITIRFKEKLFLIFKFQ